ncbi:MAG: hypothetical protein GTO18_15595 [Anaerolineales bacterium]|nr:hypothetical protein [Anaerolineales bacterium]
MSNHRAVKISMIVIPATVLLLLNACTSDEALSSEDRVATAVAETLTAQPSNSPPPSPSPIPSATDIPLPTATETLTPTPGPSPTSTVPPLPTDDPRYGLNLAQPDYRDDFSNAFTWGTWVDETTSILIKDDRLEAIDYLADFYVWWTTTVPIGANVYVEVSTEIASCSGKDSAGLGLRINEANGYSIEVSCDGNYRIRRFSEGGVDDLLEWTPSEDIVQGANATNRLGFVAKGSELHAVVNNQVLGSVEDMILLSGTFALYTNAIETPGLTILYDDFALWYF